MNEVVGHDGESRWHHEAPRPSLGEGPVCCWPPPHSSGGALGGVQVCHQVTPSPRLKKERYVEGNISTTSNAVHSRRRARSGGAALERRETECNGPDRYVALGTNSEAVHVTPDEASQVFATVRQAAAPGKVVIAGTGQLSTAATLDMTKRAADAGCDAALIVTPFYYKNSMTGEALKKHYFTIADQSPIPVMIYNVPANTGLNVASSIVAEIAQHPNVVGIKDSAGDINQIAETVRLTRSKTQGRKMQEAGGKHPERSAAESNALRAVSTDATLRSASSADFAVFSGNYGAMLPSFVVRGGGRHPGCEQHRAE